MTINAKLVGFGIVIAAFIVAQASAARTGDTSGQNNKRLHHNGSLGGSSDTAPAPKILRRGGGPDGTGDGPLAPPDQLDPFYFTVNGSASEASATGGEMLDIEIHTPDPQGGFGGSRQRFILVIDMGGLMQAVPIVGDTIHVQAPNQNLGEMKLSLLSADYGYAVNSVKVSVWKKRSSGQNGSI